MDFFEEQLHYNFHLSPTKGQKELFRKLSKFMEDEDERTIFLLKGYAGTGKTSVLESFMKAAPTLNYSVNLLAPTGRAAKVMQQYTKRFASTIHRKIYRQKDVSGLPQFSLVKNKENQTVYLVDEASMISELGELGSNGLLRDLISYVFSGERNKLILIGDEAQLPPVHLAISPALDKQHLEGYYHAKVYSHTLTEVMRQNAGSGILVNATALRDQLPLEEIEVKFNTKGFKDFYRMPAEKLEDGLRYCYDKYGLENTIVLTQSNKNAVQYNQFIRNRILYYEAEVDYGDTLMVVKNNYQTLPSESQAGFLANGEFVKVKRIGSEEEMHGFRFLNVTLSLVDYPDDPEIDTLILLDTLFSPLPNLSGEDSKKLYESVVEDYAWVKTAKERKKMIREDKYLNALQVKFAYALTCHKSQGGQWDAVFIDQFYLREETQSPEFLRWLYTAVTRGMKEVFLVNFPDKFFV
ncbi:ATP-dependent exoDNAse (exonuclease V) [Leadbetterella byssophila DSM 17132]|uniref:ATP-dependent exoDNAse (Exonuclease V) n=1 Tax=Leadbetterella byssophila (strain DSM 17132 / JCM 16389 / KACC 11308 / NBRC 106382 / 4M15) TaxID=649349 RepID=E4RU36_LEAB4|nr:AAA family ATPase [Leadbetterella byssophila]ADQ16017.1 ATP-dependent exoDNAse (exonuclease V) [Leadbetterella byssophila DSM 17132]